MDFLEDAFFLFKILCSNSLGALEHHMFQNVRGTRMSISFIYSTRLMAYVQGDGRTGVSLDYQHLEAILECEFLHLVLQIIRETRT